MKELADSGTSALAPAGSAASTIADLWWVMFVICTAVFVLVLVLLAMALILRRKTQNPAPPWGDTRFIAVFGIVLPAIVLVCLLFKTLSAGGKLQGRETSLTIQVTGHMWWWDVWYPDAGIRLANEIYIPVGEQVKIELRAADVIHSFWVPALTGKTDALPGLLTTHYLHADRPGRYRGTCAEFCGLQHARMGFFVVALEPNAFHQWLEARMKVVTSHDNSQLKLGRDSFLRRGCAECHAIRDTTAQGKTGPDLTHMGSRLSIGAAIVPNTHGNLAGWIANPQHTKPGNKMPATFLEPEELHAVTSYLMSLK